jgi:hypothetical protein
LNSQPSCSVGFGVADDVVGVEEGVNVEEGSVVNSVRVAGAGITRITCVVVVFTVVVLHIVSTYTIVDAFKNMGAGFSGLPKPVFMPATREMVKAARMASTANMKIL